MPTKTSGLLMCRESFVGDFGNNDIFVGTKGKTIIDPDTKDGQRVLRNWAKFFEPVGTNYPYLSVEQATAAPGERRGA